MEMLFLNDNMKSYLRQNIQKKLMIIDWITMLLGIFGTSMACIAVTYIPSPSLERGLLLARPNHRQGNWPTPLTFRTGTQKTAQ